VGTNSSFRSIITTVVVTLGVVALLATLNSTTPNAGATHPTATHPSAGTSAVVEPEVIDEVASKGRADVIVTLRDSHRGDDQGREQQNRATADAVLADLPPGSHTPSAPPSTVPVISMTADADAIESLRKSPQVVHVEANPVLRPTSLSSSRVVGTQQAVTDGWTGAGQSVAIVDTGVERSHSFLMRGSAPKTIAEACFSTSSSVSTSSCPGGTPMRVTDPSRSGWGSPCDAALSGSCGHGTAVAGVAAGGTGIGLPSGVAPGASIISVKVFGYDLVDPSRIGAALSDVNLGLQWLYLHRSQFPTLAAVNLSLGGGRATSDCGSLSTQAFIHQLAGVGIATVVAAGNDSFNDAVTVPACAPDAVAVAAIDDTTAARSPWSNLSPKVALLAPGTSIVSARTSGGLVSLSGTSLAAPAVTGAWATVRQRFGDMSVAEVLDHLRTTGISITTDTSGPIGRYEIPLIRVDRAMAAPVVSEELRPTDLTAVDPARLMDTRPAPTIDSLYSNTGALRGGETRVLRVAGRGYIPSHGVATIALNLTITEPTSSGFLTVFPTGGARPNASNMNVTPGALASNMVTVPVSPDGTISIFNSSGVTHVIVDVLGWFPDNGDLRPLTPARLMDTRDSSTIDGRFHDTGAFGPGESRILQVTGRGGVPSAGVGAVALNVTVAGSTGSGYITVHPAGTSRPTASNLNFTPDRIVPNMVLVPVDDRGRVQLFNSDGRTHLAVDVLGWFPDTPTFTPLTPARLLDTRDEPTVDGGFRAIGPLSGGGWMDLVVTGRGGVPSTGVSAVAINVTVDRPETSGFLTIHPAGIPLPRTSTLNFPAGLTIANTAIVPVGANGQISIYNLRGRTNVIIDVLAWFG